MDKKIVALIVVLLIIVIGVFATVLLQGNDSNQNKNEENRNLVAETNNVQNKETINNVSTEGSNTETQNGKTLILYFSQSGNTQTVANFIHEAVGGDILRLETVKTYSSNYNDLLDEAQEEQNNNARPELKTKIDNIEEYSTIFLGYPNWWGDMPMALYTFLEEYDLSGKTIAPFVTSGGSGFSNTISTIREKEPNANVVKGLSISGSSAENSQDEVEEWINNLGF